MRVVRECQGWSSKDQDWVGDVVRLVREEHGVTGTYDMVSYMVKSGALDPRVPVEMAAGEVMLQVERAVRLGVWEYVK